MALTTAQATGDWDVAGTWDNGVPDGTKDAQVPDGYVVTVQNGVTAQCLSLSVASVAGSVVVASGGSLDIGTGGLQVISGCTLTLNDSCFCAGPISLENGSIATGTITWDAAGAVNLDLDNGSFPNLTLTVNGTATFTFSVAGTIYRLLVNAAFGTLAGTANLTVLAGGFSRTNLGTNNWTGKLILGASCSGDWNDQGNCLKEIDQRTHDGVNFAMTNHVRCRAFRHGTGTVSGAFTLIVLPTASDFWTTGSGAITCNSVAVNLSDASADESNTDPITATPASTLQLATPSAYRLTLSGGADIGASADLVVYGSLGGDTGKITINGFTGRDALLGLASASNRSGDLTLQGHSSIRNCNRQHASDTGCALRLEAGTTIASTGTVDATGVTVAGNSGRFTGGTVQNVTLTAGDRLIAWGCTCSGNSDGVEPAARVGGMLHTGLLLMAARRLGAF